MVLLMDYLHGGVAAGTVGATIGAGVGVSEKNDRTFTVSLREVLEYHYKNGEIPEFICSPNEIIKPIYNN